MASLILAAGATLNGKTRSRGPAQCCASAGFAGRDQMLPFTGPAIDYLFQATTGAGHMKGSRLV
jgi:hypothetical protein